MTPYPPKQDGRLEKQVADLQRELATVREENTLLRASLNRTENNELSTTRPEVPAWIPDMDMPTTATPGNLTTDEKVAIFQRLFKGRSDMYPVRWESRTSGKSGYAPACGNEWKPGICEKPRIKWSRRIFG